MGLENLLLVLSAGKPVKVYFRNRMSYRKKSVLFAGCCFTLIGTCAPIHYIVNIRPIEILALLFIGGISLMMFVVGLWLISAWFTRLEYALEISDIGIKFGRRSRKWEEIERLSFGEYKGGLQMILFKPKGFSSEFQVHLSNTVTDDEIDSLFQSLETDIVPRHKGLQLDFE